MKIAVIAGGTSTERNVSFQTGKMVASALKENGHDVCFLDVFMGINEVNLDTCFNMTDFDSIAEEINENAPDIESLLKMERPGNDGFFGPNVLNICKSADIVFIALHGANGEDGRIQAVFELLNIPYTGSGSFGSQISMHKGMTKHVMRQVGVPTPSGVCLHKSNRDTFVRNIDFPCVIKPCCGGSSVGVSIVDNEADYKIALNEAFSYEDEVIIEEYIKGRELSTGIIDGKALPIIEIQPLTGFYDYKNKYQPGMALDICPAQIGDEATAKIQEYTETLYKALHLDIYSRIDFLLTEDGSIYCLEANTLPGMTRTSLLPQEAAEVGINFNELCEKIIQLSLAKRKR